MSVTLLEYKAEAAQMKQLIQQFWFCHSNASQTDEEAAQDLTVWTQEGHRLFFILYDKEPVGFVHLGSRGGRVDWLEDLFVKPEYQNQGIGTKAIQLAEEIVKEYSISMYIEAAARNEKAIRLYRNLGYDCLNSITVRKDFDTSSLVCTRKEQLYGREFEIRKVK